MVKPLAQVFVLANVARADMGLREEVVERLVAGEVFEELLHAVERLAEVLLGRGAVYEGGEVSTMLTCLRCQSVPSRRSSSERVVSMEVGK